MPTSNERKMLSSNEALKELITVTFQYISTGNVNPFTNTAYFCKLIASLSALVV